MIAHYFRVWVYLARMGFLMQLANRWSSLGWLGGKVIRLVFFAVFILGIFSHIKQVRGYSLEEVALFFLTFNVVDIVSQTLFRGIYMIGRDIREGDMDFYLLNPIHPLFRTASNLIDFLDFLTLIPVLGTTVWILHRLLDGFTAAAIVGKIALYLLLCANGVWIAFSLHVMIASLTVRTQQMENTIWLYRDIAGLGRFPIDIYPTILQWFLTFILPIGVMVTFPAQALTGALSITAVFGACIGAFVLHLISMSMWNWALGHYSSVSS